MFKVNQKFTNMIHWYYRVMSRMDQNGWMEIVRTLPLTVGLRPPERATLCERLFLLKNTKREPATHNGVHKTLPHSQLHFQILRK